MKINHIGIVVKDIEKSVRYYGDFFGFKKVSDIFYDENQKVNVVFLKSECKDYVFELIEPVGKDSPVNNSLKKGGGLNHICYEVKDIKKTIEELKEKGGRLISGPSYANAFEGKKIAFFYTKNREVIELVEK